MLTINVVTLFPEMFEGPLRVSIPGRAAEQGLVRYRVVQLREYTHDRHKTVDDSPYGGGAGMVLKPEPFFEAVEDLRPGGGAAHRAVVGARPTLHTPRRRAVRGGPAADAVVWALQRRGSAGGGRAGGGGAVGRGLRAVGWRAGGAVCRGCGGAAAPGSAGGS